MADVKKEKEKKKSVAWKFDEATSTMSVDTATSVKAEVESAFSFELEIYKDDDTHVESMKIINYKNGVENGSIITSIMDLGSDIKNFKRFGVVIGDTYFRDLARRIEDEYSKIRIGAVNLSSGDPRYNDLLAEIKRYFTEYRENDYITAEFCNIPVNQFNGLASDCGYSEYEMKNLRSQLAKDGYIHKVSNRYAILKRLAGKPERVVAFYRGKLGIEMPVKSTKKQAEKSGADE